jgi:hypothetical protein
MPMWLFTAYAEMYGRLRAETQLELIQALEAAGNRYMRPQDRRQFMRELELAVNGGRMPKAQRPKTMAALASVAGLKIEGAGGEKISDGGVVLPAGAGA